MQRSKLEVHLHIVWATYRRPPLVNADIEDTIHSLIAGEVERAGCSVLAVGGMPDHIHLALNLSPLISIAKLVQQVKGVSSTRVRQQNLTEGAFGWQDNYAAFSFSRSHLDRVLAYIRNQKRHHSEGSLWAAWEHLEAETPQAGTGQEL